LHLGDVVVFRETHRVIMNRFLAEDRILCFELVAKANAKWVLGVGTITPKNMDYNLIRALER
jgi:hypothetical protein